MEENAQEATRKERGKQHKYQLKYQNIPYQNQNFISISRKIIVSLCYRMPIDNRRNTKKNIAVIQSPRNGQTF